MDITAVHFLIVCPLAFLAGAVDSIAGGGGLISLPAYILAGLPPHLAIGTNKISSVMGTTVATVKYAKSGFIPWKPAVFCIPCALLGSSIGAGLSLAFDEEYFKIFMLIALPLIALYVIFGKALRDDVHEYSLIRTVIVSATAAFVIGMYDGFYGPGTGTFLLVILNVFAHMAVRRANGLTKVINLSTNVAALTVFSVNLTIIPLLGIVAGLFNMAGNYIGASYFTKLGARAAKPVLIVVLVIFFIKIITELFPIVSN